MQNIINFPKKHLTEEHQNTLTHHQKLITFGYQVTMGLGIFALTAPAIASPSSVNANFQN